MNDPVARADRPDPAAELRSRRRAAARRHHPDLGGDAEAFRRAMAEVEAGGALVDRAILDQSPATTGSAPVTVVHRHRAITAAATVTAVGIRLVAELRARLPRSVPGSRRFHDL